MNEEGPTSWAPLSGPLTNLIRRAGGGRAAAAVNVNLNLSSYLLYSQQLQQEQEQQQQQLQLQLQLQPQQQQQQLPQLQLPHQEHYASLQFQQEVPLGAGYAHDQAITSTASSSTWSQLVATLFYQGSPVLNSGLAQTGSGGAGSGEAPTGDSVAIDVDWASLILALVLIMLMLTTAIGNLFVIVAILIERNLRTIGNYLVLSLAIADLLVACLVMPLAGIYQILDRWTLGILLCDIWTSTDVFCCTASILHLLAIALDRYWAVTRVDYIRCQRNERRILFMIFLVWTAASIISLAPVFGWKDEKFEWRITNEFECLISQDIGYQIFATCTTFYFPLTLTLIFYWKIYQVARKRIRRKPGNRVKISLQHPSSSSSNSWSASAIAKQQLLRPKQMIVRCAGLDANSSALCKSALIAQQTGKLAQSKQTPEGPATCQCTCHEKAVQLLLNLSGETEADTSRPAAPEAQNRDCLTKKTTTKTTTMTTMTTTTIMPDAPPTRTNNEASASATINCELPDRQSATNNDPKRKGSSPKPDKEDTESVLGALKKVAYPRVATDPGVRVRRCRLCDSTVRRRDSSVSGWVEAANGSAEGNSISSSGVRTASFDSVWQSTSMDNPGQGGTNCNRNCNHELGTNLSQAGSCSSSKLDQASSARIQLSRVAVTQCERCNSPSAGARTFANVSSSQFYDEDYAGDSTNSDQTDAKDGEDDDCCHHCCCQKTSLECACLPESSQVATSGCGDKLTNLDEAQAAPASRNAIKPQRASSAIQRDTWMAGCQPDVLPGDRESSNETLRRPLMRRLSSPVGLFRQGVAAPVGVAWGRLMSQVAQRRPTLAPAVVTFEGDSGGSPRGLGAQPEVVARCERCKCLPSPQVSLRTGNSAKKVEMVEGEEEEDGAHSKFEPALVKGPLSLVDSPTTNAVVAASTAQVAVTAVGPPIGPAASSLCVHYQQSVAAAEGLESKRERKAAKTLAIITGVFVMCWLPFFIMAITMPLLNLKPHKYLFAFMLWLGYANSMLNPIIYTIFSPDFRKAFKRLLCGFDERKGHIRNGIDKRNSRHNFSNRSANANRSHATPVAPPRGPLVRCRTVLASVSPRLLLGRLWPQGEQMDTRCSPIRPTGNAAPSNFGTRDGESNRNGNMNRGPKDCIVSMKNGTSGLRTNLLDRPSSSPPDSSLSGSQKTSPSAGSQVALRRAQQAQRDGDKPIGSVVIRNDF